MKIWTCTKTWTQTFIAALFTITKTWNNTNVSQWASGYKKVAYPEWTTTQQQKGNSTDIHGTGGSQKHSTKLKNSETKDYYL